VTDVVEDLLALGGEGVDPLRSLGPRRGDAAVEAVEVELEGLELELGGRRVELAGADDELGDEAGERLVALRQLAGGRAEAAAEVAGRAPGGRGGEHLVEVRLPEPLLPLVGQREAVGQERALGLLAAIERGSCAVAGRWR
jgi:hypothetical protein